MKRWLWWLVLAVVAGLVAVVLAPGRAKAAPVDLRQIIPSATDPAIDTANDPHLVAPPQAGPAEGLLFVFLPGSDGTPSQTTQVLGQAAALGFRTIGLNYPNSPSVGQRCGSDVDCYGPLRQTVFDGTPSPKSDVNAANSIQHRLVALLEHLQREYPSEGWSAYLRSDGTPAYDKIVFSGVSQGAGEAAYIGKIRELAGVVMFSGVVDSSSAIGSDPAPAAWTTGAGRTPIERYTALAHVGDIFYRSIRANWTALGMDALGPATVISDSAPPYGGTHELLMSSPSWHFGIIDHAMPVGDRLLRTCPNGTPALAPAWRYLMLTAAGLPVTDLPASC